VPSRYEKPCRRRESRSSDPAGSRRNRRAVRNRQAVGGVVQPSTEAVTPHPHYGVVPDIRERRQRVDVDLAIVLFDPWRASFIAKSRFKVRWSWRASHPARIRRRAHPLVPGATSANHTVADQLRKSRAKSAAGGRIGVSTRASGAGVLSLVRQQAQFLRCLLKDVDAVLVCWKPAWIACFPRVDDVVRQTGSPWRQSSQGTACPMHCSVPPG